MEDILITPAPADAEMIGSTISSSEEISEGSAYSEALTDSSSRSTIYSDDFIIYSNEETSTGSIISSADNTSSEVDMSASTSPSVLEFLESPRYVPKPCRHIPEPDHHVPETSRFVPKPAHHVPKVPAEINIEESNHHLCRPCSGICSCCFENKYYGMCSACMLCMISPLILLITCGGIITTGVCMAGTCCCCCFCGCLAFKDEWRQARFDDLLSCCMYTCCCFIPTSVYDEYESRD